MKLLREHVTAARGVLLITRADIAKIAGVSLQTVARFERGEETLKDSTLWQIQTALEHCGIEFLNGGKPGVRYHPERDRRNLGKSSERDRTAD